MKKPLVEFIGTFFLCLTVATAAVLGTAGAAAPIAIGLVLAVMIYAGGHVSGGHYNPAVTLAVFLRGRISGKDAIPYLVAQLAAAVAACFVAKQLVPAVKVDALTFTASTPVILAEFLFTFALCHVVLNAATTKSQAGNSFFGAAIGLTVTAGAFTVGSISGGAFNPAVTTLLITIGKLHAADCWMHLLPQIIGAIAAAFTFKVINPTDR